jgi:hypothetical protein
MTTNRTSEQPMRIPLIIGVLAAVAAGLLVVLGAIFGIGGFQKDLASNCIRIGFVFSTGPLTRSTVPTLMMSTHSMVRARSRRIATQIRGKKTR